MRVVFIIHNKIMCTLTREYKVRHENGGSDFSCMALLVVSVGPRNLTPHWGFKGNTPTTASFLRIQLSELFPTQWFDSAPVN